MSKLLVNDKDVVVPGEVLAEGMEFLPSFGTYRAKEEIIASRLGMVNIDQKVIKIVPLSGKYMPREGDVVIGKVFDINFAGWMTDINCAYSSLLGLKEGTSAFVEKGDDLTRFYAIGDYIVAKISLVTSQKSINLTTKGPGLRKITGGRVINISPMKVPRVIGKKGSMVEMIKEATKCNIVVGQNGLVWIDGEPEKMIVAEKIIRKIDEDAHQEGLTDKIKQMLEKEMRK